MEAKASNTSFSFLTIYFLNLEAFLLKSAMIGISENIAESKKDIWGSYFSEPLKSLGVQSQLHIEEYRGKEAMIM